MPVLWLATKALASRLLFFVPKGRGRGRIDDRSQTSDETRGSNSEQLALDYNSIIRVQSTLLWCIRMLELVNGESLSSAHWFDVCNRAFRSHVREQQRKGLRKDDGEDG